MKRSGRKKKQPVKDDNVNMNCRSVDKTRWEMCAELAGGVDLTAWIIVILNAEAEKRLGAPAPPRPNGGPVEPRGRIR
jgi:hypothetical protein